MRSIVIAAPLLAVLALTACKDQPKTADQVKQEMAQMPKPKPGLYRSTSKLISFEVPGMPQQQQDQFKQIFSQQTGRDFCLTKAEAAKGYEEMTKKLAEGKCTYDKFEASGSSLDAKMSCETGKDMKATVAMKGTMSTESSQMTMTVEQSSPQLPGKSMKITAEVASTRVGDCPGA
jgi:hypothetical protein